MRQGDPVSPKLFSSVLEDVFRKLDWTHQGLNLNGSRLNHRRFADDLVIFAENPEILLLIMESEKVRLKMNIVKTKAMTNSSKIEIKLNNQTLEYVDD